MLEFPTDKEVGLKLAREFNRIKNDYPAIIQWLKDNELKIMKINSEMEPEITFRRNQGALMLLADFFKNIEEARNTYNNLTEGE